MNSKQQAIYFLGNMKIKGHVISADDGLYWFNTPEREKENRADLLVSATDVKVIIK